MSTSEDPLEGFALSDRFTRDRVATVPDEPGVHVVYAADGTLIFVGQSKHTRTRLYQHLSGDREASVLHGKIGRQLDAELGRPASRDEIRDWLERCMFKYKITD